MAEAEELGKRIESVERQQNEQFIQLRKAQAGLKKTLRMETETDQISGLPSDGQIARDLADLAGNSVPASGRAKRGHNEKVILELLKMAGQKGLSASEISSKLNLKKSSVYATLKKKGLFEEAGKGLWRLHQINGS